MPAYFSSNPRSKLRYVHENYARRVSFSNDVAVLTYLPKTQLGAISLAGIQDVSERTLLTEIYSQILPFCDEAQKVFLTDQFSRFAKCSNDERFPTSYQFHSDAWVFSEGISLFDGHVSYAVLTQQHLLNKQGYELFHEGHLCVFQTEGIQSTFFSHIAMNLMNRFCQKDHHRTITDILHRLEN